MMNRGSSRMAWLVRSALLVGAAWLAGTTPAWATFIDSDPDIVTAMVPLPASVTLSTTALPTYASYQVTLTHNATNAQLKPVMFTATTTVVDSAGVAVPAQTAAFVPASLPVGCTSTTPSTINCSFSDGLLTPGAVKSFAVTVTAPSAGFKVNFKSKTSWKEWIYFTESTPEATVSTLLSAPDPLKVSSFVPPGGATLFTGVNGGLPTIDNTWTTTLNLPATAAAAVVNIQNAINPVTCAPNLTTCNSSTLSIPGGVFDHLTITLRRYATTIAKHAKISSAHVYYSGPAHPDPRVTTYNVGLGFDVPSCTVTTYSPDVLPVQGIPCIKSRTAVYKSVIGETEHDDDEKVLLYWEFVIWAKDNGKYQN